MTAILDLRDIQKSFGGLVALDQVSLTVEAGSITALIGPNGSGKTTLFQVVSGLMAPDGGTVVLDGVDVTHSRPEQRAHRGLGRAFQVARPLAALTVRENLLPGLIYGANPIALRDTGPPAIELLDTVGLRSKADVPAGALTLWEKKALEVARALSVGHRLLLLDEVFAGLSPADVDRMIEVVRRVRNERGATILLVEHVMRATMALAEHIVVLSFGSVIAMGTPDQVTRNARVIDVYLGPGHFDGHDDPGPRGPVSHGPEPQARP